MRRIVILWLLGSFACAPAPSETRHTEWRLSDDVAAFEQQYGADPEYQYRIDQIASAWNAPEYLAFQEEVANAPPARRAFIYYEISPANGLYFFALTTDGPACRIVALDYQGREEHACRGIPDFEIGALGDRMAIRDPASVGLEHRPIELNQFDQRTMLSNLKFRA